ncbi:hypothetical protein [Romboutsia sp.]|uniref:hypothetical protein n=1 Tax=Romboutsia sp. TaxID=1965302 RepID=UPI002C1D504C|nr:hypothetical protein [Romboutsia sp.]HSQ90485.1 hypothetical protein [Romboutsia sp.]
MNSLDIKINEIKSNLMNENIKAIRKSKLKVIKSEDIKNIRLEDRNLLEEYNYYVKLLKKIKKYINKNKDLLTILNVENDKIGKIIYIVVTINIKEISIGIPIELRIITGDTNDTYMDCTYYKIKDESRLYINDFKSTRPNQGYGGILLKNLDNIVNEANKYLRIYKFKDIKIIEGHLVANKNIISESDLKDMYAKYGFEIDSKNNMKRKVYNIN